MGLVETLLELATVKSVSVFLLGSFVAWRVALRVDEHIRIKRLGNYGPKIPMWAPYGE